MRPACITWPHSHLNCFDPEEGGQNVPPEFSYPPITLCVTTQEPQSEHQQVWYSDLFSVEMFHKHEMHVTLHLLPCNKNREWWCTKSALGARLQKGAQMSWSFSKHYSTCLQEKLIWGYQEALNISGSRQGVGGNSKIGWEKKSNVNQQYPMVM